MTVNKIICQDILNKAPSVFHALKNAGVNNFGYRQFYLDGSSIGFCTYNAWDHIESMENFIDSMGDHYKNELLEYNQKNHQFFIRTGDIKSDSYFLQTLRKHSLWNTLVLYKIKDSFVEGYYFISSCEHNSTVNYFLNNRDIFYQISNSLDKPLDSLMLPLKYKDISLHLLDNSTIKNCITKAHSNDKFNILTKTNLSRKEMMIILSLSDGFSTKNIAQKYGNSPRTIEKHISNIKEKLYLHNKDQIIEFVRNNYLKTSEGYFYGDC